MKRPNQGLHSTKQRGFGSVVSLLLAWSLPSTPSPAGKLRGSRTLLINSLPGSVHGTDQGLVNIYEMNEYVYL